MGIARCHHCGDLAVVHVYTDRLLLGRFGGGFRSSFAGVLRELSTAFAHSFAAALELKVLDVWP